MTDENIEILRDSCIELRDVAMIDLLSSTGMRVGELVKMNRDDIVFFEFINISDVTDVCKYIENADDTDFSKQIENADDTDVSNQAESTDNIKEQEQNIANFIAADNNDKIGFN